MNKIIKRVVSVAAAVAVAVSTTVVFDVPGLTAYADANGTFGRIHIIIGNLRKAPEY